MAKPKHFLPTAPAAVSAALRAQPRLNPSVRLDAEQKVLYLGRRRGGKQRVGILSGGGSGHEPSFAGFVGAGLLSASVAGSVFASPGAEQVRVAVARAQEAVGGGAVCVVVMNYTGDILNFGMAVEKARASGVAVDMVVVGDDVGVGREKSGKVGRRGIAGTCLVLKIAGALAAKGASLEHVSKTARLVAQNIVSVGASLSHVHVPGRNDDVENEIKDGEVEVGMGIHNEPGSEITTLDLESLVKKMLGQMLDPADKDRNYLQIGRGEDSVLLVNNLGGVSPLEFAALVDIACDQLESTYGLQPTRVIAGTFMTSLNGMGFSLSVLKVVDVGLGSGSSMIELLDEPSEALGWASPVSAATWSTERQAPAEIHLKETEELEPCGIKISFARSRTALWVALRRLIKAEPEITKYDTIVGDGDCGVGLKRGAEALIDMLDKSEPTDDLAVFLGRIVRVVESSMDGTSGALYFIFLQALTRNIRGLSSGQPEDIQAGIWARALESSILELAKYTPAQPGDRTLVDALHPFVGTLSHTGNVAKAAAAAEEGSKKTMSMKASLGRSVYVGGKGWQDVPDPGAYGLSEFLLGLAQGLQ